MWSAYVRLKCELCWKCFGSTVLYQANIPYAVCHFPKYDEYDSILTFTQPQRKSLQNSVSQSPRLVKWSVVDLRESTPAEESQCYWNKIGSVNRKATDSDTPFPFPLSIPLIWTYICFSLFPTVSDPSLPPHGSFSIQQILDESNLGKPKAHTIYFFMWGLEWVDDGCRVRQFGSGLLIWMHIMHYWDATLKLVPTKAACIAYRVFKFKRLWY